MKYWSQIQILNYQLFFKIIHKEYLLKKIPSQKRIQCVKTVSDYLLQVCSLRFDQLWTTHVTRLDRYPTLMYEWVVTYYRVQWDRETCQDLYLQIERSSSSGRSRAQSIAPSEIATSIGFVSLRLDFTIEVEKLMVGW